MNPGRAFRNASIASLAAAFLVAFATAQPQIHPDELKMKPEIDAAIARGVEALLREQHRDGSWGVHGEHVGGKTGLCLYALLSTGVQADHPAVQRAVAHLDAIEPDRTYAVACMMLAYGALRTEGYERRLQSLLRLLLDWQKSSGDWGYPHDRPDLSNTQYAALGLWSAQKNGIAVPRKAWLDLIDGVFRYREEARLVDAPQAALASEPTRTGSSKIQVAGFSYVPGQKASGSMTTAGISVLQICKIGLDNQLRRDDRRRIDDAIETGLQWLAVNFDVTRNPFQGGHHYYYLYGLERVGSLTGVEQIGPYWWYLRGARHLLTNQNQNGFWPKNGLNDIDSCYALLFLRRATTGRPPTTGARSTGEHLFAAGDKHADVQLRGAGQQPLALWIDAFGDKVLQRHERDGLRVAKVEYVEGDLVLGACAGDPAKTWRAAMDSFLYRCTALRRGPHQIKARVTLIAPGAPVDESSATETIESAVMSVDIRDVFEPWMQVAAQLRRDNLLRGMKITATATSNGDRALMSADGVDTTHWVSTKDDDTPTLTLDLEKTVAARRILLTQPPTHDGEVARFDQVLEVELRFNNDKKSTRIRLDPDPIALTAFELPETRRVRRLTLTITDRVRRTGAAGFAEVGLARRSK